MANQRSWPVTEDSMVIVKMAIEKRDEALAMFNRAIEIARKLSDVPDEVEADNLSLENNLWLERPTPED